MKKVLFTLFVMLMLPLGMAGGVRNEASIRVIVNRPASAGHDHLVEPIAYYYPASTMLTVEFPATDFEPYTLSVSSTLTTLDYYVTTPYVCVPIMLTGLTYDIQLETDAGDVYWGVLDLSEATSME